MVLMDNTQALALIERAERDTRFCDCGEPMAPVARSSQVWLECRSLPAPAGGGVRRLFTTLAAAGHTRSLILDAA
jgi:hypothetical protein